MIKRWEQYLRLKNFSPLTIRRNLSKAKQFSDYLQSIGISDFANLKQSHIDSYLLQRTYHINCYNRSNSPATRNQELICLRNFLKFLAQEKIVTITIQLPKIRLPKLTLPKAILTKSELLALFAQPDLGTVLGYRDRLILELLYATGIRHAELCNLQTNHLNFEDKTIFIQSGKGDKDRVVPCNETALQFAKNYLAEIRPQLITGHNHYLILNYLGLPFARPRLDQIIQKYRLSARLKKQITCHSFRHTFATHLLQKGMQLRHVQELLGHQDINNTLRYLQLNIKDLQKEYNRFHPQALHQQ